MPAAFVDEEGVAHLVMADSPDLGRLCALASEKTLRQMFSQDEEEELCQIFLGASSS